MNRPVIVGKVVGVFRKCRRCLRWRTIGNFTHTRIGGRTYVSHICGRCRLERVLPTPSGTGLARAIVLTVQGRAVLAELAGEVSCEQLKTRGRDALTSDPAAQET